MNQQFSITAVGALRSSLCGAILALHSFVAIAQANQSTVIVTGSRFEENLNEVPANVKVITRDEIDASTSNNIPDVLSQIGGLNLRNFNGGGQLNLDASVDMGGYGITANSTTLILVDGQRVNPIDSSSVFWESIPLDSIDRIEILQGGASVQYGNGAVGGVINIITNGNTSKLNQASVTYGSFGTLINNAILRDSYESTTYQLTANTSNTNGWRQNSAANAYAFDAKVTQKFSGIDKAYIDLFYGYTNEQLPGAVLGQVGGGNPQAAFFKNIGSSSTVNNSGVRFGGTKELAEGYLSELDASYTNRTVFFNYPFFDTDPAVNTSTGSPVWSNTSNTLSGWQLNLSPRIKADFGPIATIIGYEFNKASQGSIGSYGPNQLNSYMIPFGYVNNPTNQTNNVQSASLLNQSVYGLLKLPITNGINFTGGARHQIQQASTYFSGIGSIDGASTANQTFSANAGDAAFNFNYAKNQSLYLKWNQSYRFPNIDEFWGSDPATGSQVFNGILKPQTAQTYEVGGNWMLNTIRINGSVFSSVSQNEITFNPSTGANYNSPFNINRRGVALNSSANITNRLSIAGGGKFQRSYYADGPYTGQTIPVVPNLTLNARANYSINQNWSVGGVVNYVGTQHYDATPGLYSSLTPMPSYTVGDVFLNYKTGGWDSKFMIKNVGNALYSTYGGFTSVQMADGSFANSYFYYPSDKRSYFFTTKYTF
jgi:iron complex outermembrane receptor protein